MSESSNDRLVALRRQRAEIDAQIRAAETNEELPPVVIPPLIQLAQETFANDLPQLLRDRPGQWVAYRGAERVGFANDDWELYQQCARHGYTLDEIVVRVIEPQCHAMVGTLIEVPEGHEQTESRR